MTSPTLEDLQARVSEVYDDHLPPVLDLRPRAVLVCPDCDDVLAPVPDSIQIG